jgi:hypothetical protein
VDGAVVRHVVTNQILAHMQPTQRLANQVLNVGLNTVANPVMMVIRLVNNVQLLQVKHMADTFTATSTPTCAPTSSWPTRPSTSATGGGDRLEDDRRWVYGTPPVGNANYAWLQHMLHHLARAAGRHRAGQRQHVVQPEQRRRHPRAMVEADVVEVMVALPPQLFFNTQIPACLWFLAKDKKRPRPARRGAVHRRPQAGPHGKARATA